MTTEQAAPAPPAVTPSSEPHGPSTAVPTDMPSFPEAERATLGALMLSPTAAARLIPVLSEEHFYYWQNARVYTAIKELHQQGRLIDPITVHAKLREHGHTRFGYRDVGVYLAECLEAAYFPGRANDYAAHVLDNAARRRLIYEGTRITQRASNPTDAETTELINDAHQRIGAITELLRTRDTLLTADADKVGGIEL
jgi:replicative DNA helicase